MIFALLLVACKEDPKEASATVEELTVGWFAAFDTEEGAGQAVSLAEWMRNNGGEEPVRYVMPDLGEDDTAGLEHDEELDYAAMIGAGVLRRVEGSLDKYTALMVQADQLKANDSGNNAWDREIVDGSASAFLNGASMDVHDEIIQNAIITEIPYTIERQYRWVEDEENGEALVVNMAWIPEAGWDEDHENGVVGGFTVELFVPDGDGTFWFNVSWEQVVAVLGDEDFLYKQIAGGIEDVMEGTQAWANE